MNNAKVDEVLSGIAVLLRQRGFGAIRHPADQPLPMSRPTTASLQHARWMVTEALTFPPEKVEKKMRWLGFIQGVLWVAGVTTIEAAKQANMPTEER